MGQITPQEVYLFADGLWSRVEKEAPEEADMALYVNGHELVTLLCTPALLKELAVGFLYSAKIIRGVSDILGIDCKRDRIDVSLMDSHLALPREVTITSGLGGVGLGRIPAGPVSSSPAIRTEDLMALAEEAARRAVCYQKTGGIHFSALCTGRCILAFAEDIGRHNTVDKIVGICLTQSISPQGTLLLTSGRVSSEMLGKAASLGIAAIVSMSTPTQKALETARRLDMTLAGYLLSGKPGGLTVYHGAGHFVLE